MKYDVMEFEGTELEGVLPSIEFVIEHLSAYHPQFALAVKHLGNAAKSVHKVGTES